MGNAGANRIATLVIASVCAGAAAALLAWLLAGSFRASEADRIARQPVSLAGDRPTAGEPPALLRYPPITGAGAAVVAFVVGGVYLLVRDQR